MNMQTMHDLKEILCRELDEIRRKSNGSISMSDLDKMHKLTDTIKNIDKIAMLEDDEEGYSERRDSMGRYSRGDGHWQAEGMYSRAPYDENGSSYARRGRHYVRAHYSRDDGMGGGDRETRAGYSRGDGRGEMMGELEDLMQEAKGKERDIIRRAMDELRRA